MKGINQEYESKIENVNQLKIRLKEAEENGETAAMAGKMLLEKLQETQYNSRMKEDELNDRISAISKEFEKLKLKHHEEVKARSKTIDSYLTDIEDLRQQIATLKSEKENVQKELRENRDHKRKYMALSEEFEKLKQEMQEKNKALAATTKNSLSLQQKNGNLTVITDNLSSEVANLRDKLVHYQNTIEALKGNITHLKHRYEESESLKKTLGAEIEEKKSSNNLMAARIQELVQQRQLLLSENEKLKKEKLKEGTEILLTINSQAILTHFFVNLLIIFVAKQISKYNLLKVPSSVQNFLNLMQSLSINPSFVCASLVNRIIFRHEISQKYDDHKKKTIKNIINDCIGTGSWIKRSQQELQIANP